MQKNYFNNCKKEFELLLLERKNSITRNESALQSFFEKYPFAILSCLTAQTRFSVFSNIVVSQPRIKSYDGDRIPDFLIVTEDSLNLYFNFIEIEDPSKKIFNSTKQSPSSDFFQAHNQLIQWRSLTKKVNEYCNHLLETLFLDNIYSSKNRVIHKNFILVYGFGEDISKLGKRHNEIFQNYFLEPDIFHCTFSRLQKNLRLERPMFSVKYESKSNKYKAIGVTPFTKYDIEQWSNFHNIIEKEAIINSSIFFEEEEKEDLIKNIKYFDNISLDEMIKLNLNSGGSNIFFPDSFVL